MAEHNHKTEQIRPRGECPGCDEIHAKYDERRQNPPPGPAPLPRCEECNATPSITKGRFHEDWCPKGQEQQAHAVNVRAVEAGLKEALDRRRQDRAFMERLAARIRSDANILDALASDEPGGAA